MKQLYKLPPPMGQAASDLLLVKQSTAKSKRLPQRGRKGGAFRLEVPREPALRIICKESQLGAIAVFVGLHADYDRFLDSWRGHIRGRILSLFELELNMNKRQITNDLKQDQKTKASALAPAVEMLYDEFQNVLRQAVSAEVSSNLETVAELGREQVQSGISQLSDSLRKNSDVVANQDAMLTKLASSVNELSQRLHSHEARRSEQAKAVDRDLNRICADVQSAVDKAVSATYPLMRHDLDKFSASVCQQTSEVCERLDATATTLSSLFQSLRSEVHAANTRDEITKRDLNALTEKLSAVEEGLGRLATQNERASAMRSWRLLDQLKMSAVQIWTKIQILSRYTFWRAGRTALSTRDSTTESQHTPTRFEEFNERQEVTGKPQKTNARCS